MKKLAAVIILALSGGAIAAQDLVMEPQKSNIYPISNNHGQAPGLYSGTPSDTLLYFEGYNFFVSNPVDASAFSYMNTGTNAMVASALSNSPFASASSFVFFYALDPNNDTVNYIGATSWFNPIGRANNWFTFGPVTIPSSGATLHWQHSMPNNSYRDGYKVRISTTGLIPYLDFSDTSSIFGFDDKSPYTVNDTSWTKQIVELDPVYNGQQVYIAFHHDANDMFILYLDEILLTEGVTGIKEEPAEFVSVDHIRPNPSSNYALINYRLQGNEKVSIVIYDITGKEVLRMDEGMQSRGVYNVKVDVSSMASGIYYYTVNAGSYKAAQKMIVSR